MPPQCPAYGLGEVTGVGRDMGRTGSAAQNVERAGSADGSKLPPIALSAWSLFLSLGLLHFCTFTLIVFVYLEAINAVIALNATILNSGLFTVQQR